jgi:molybdopterin synthase catalytic subunit
MGGRVHVAVSEAPLSCDAALQFLQDPAHGAVSSFIGQVRNLNDGKAVNGISYDVFIPLALRTFETITAEARQRWGTNLNIWLEHYKGRLNVGGLSIVIAVSSPHRDEACQACRFIIEQVKHSSPIWKQEHYVAGDSGWVQGYALGN